MQPPAAEPRANLSPNGELLDQARLAAVLLSSSEPQLVLDAQHRSPAAEPEAAEVEVEVDFLCAAANHAACLPYGLAPAEVVGRRLMEVFPPHFAVALFALCQRALAQEGRQVWGKHEEPSSTSGDLLLRSIRVVRVGAALSCSWSGWRRDSGPPAPPQQRQPAGLMSPPDLLGQFFRLYPPGQHRSQPLALATCQLRNLRQIHAEHGSACADGAVLTVQKRLRRILGPHTMVARISIDQVLVVLSGLDNLAQAAAIAEAMGVVMGLPLPVPDTSPRLTAWVDVALEQPGERVEELFEKVLRRAEALPTAA